MSLLLCVISLRLTNAFYVLLLRIVCYSEKVSKLESAAFANVTLLAAGDTVAAITSQVSDHDLVNSSLFAR